MVCKEDKDISLLPSLSNSGRRIRIENFRDTDMEGFVQDVAMLRGR